MVKEQAEKICHTIAMKTVRELRTFHNEYVSKQSEDIDPAELFEPYSCVEPTEGDEQVISLANIYMEMLSKRGLVI